MHFTVCGIYYSFNKATSSRKTMSLRPLKHKIEYIEFKMHPNFQFRKMCEKLCLRFKVIW
jgi:hypothetical protein